MHPEASRVVYNDQPYLVLLGEDGSVQRAYGPFGPGTEPSLRECSPETEVQDPSVLAALHDLLPLSPKLPAHEDTLAGS